MSLFKSHHLTYRPLGWLIRLFYIYIYIYVYIAYMSTFQQFSAIVYFSKCHNWNLDMCLGAVSACPKIQIWGNIKIGKQWLAKPNRSNRGPPWNVREDIHIYWCCEPWLGASEPSSPSAQSSVSPWQAKLHRGQVPPMVQASPFNWPPNSNLANLVIYCFCSLKYQHFVT